MKLSMMKDGGFVGFILFALLLLLPLHPTASTPFSNPESVQGEEQTIGWPRNPTPKEITYEEGSQGDMLRYQDGEDDAPLFHLAYHPQLQSDELQLPSWWNRDSEFEESETDSESGPGRVVRRKTRTISHTPSHHSTPHHSSPSHSTPSHSTPSHSTPSHSTPSHSTPSHSTPSHSPSPSHPSPSPSSHSPSPSPSHSTIPSITISPPDHSPSPSHSTSTFPIRSTNPSPSTSTDHLTVPGHSTIPSHDDTTTPIIHSTRGNPKNIGRISDRDSGASKFVGSLPPFLTLGISIILLL